MEVNKTAHFWTRRCLTFQTSKRLVSGIWWVSISQSYTKSRQNITKQEQTKNNRCCVQRQQNESLVENELQHVKLFKLERMFRCHVLLLSACFFVFFPLPGFSSEFPTQQITDTSNTTVRRWFALSNVDLVLDEVRFQPSLLLTWTSERFFL